MQEGGAAALKYRSACEIKQLAVALSETWAYRVVWCVCVSRAVSAREKRFAFSTLKVLAEAKRHLPSFAYSRLVLVLRQD